MERGAMSQDAGRTLRTLFKRCLECPDTNPVCPPCGKGEICSLIPKGCYNCAHMVCIQDPSPAPTSSGPNVGAIAGGVVGGVAFVAIAVFLVWWFWIRKRRRQQEADGWISEEEEEEMEQDDIANAKRAGEERRFTAFRSADAMSTRTRGSVANSILSRASNVIQIAFIPGVMTRNGGSAHNSLAPVPPVPSAQRSAPKSPLSHQDDALFFSPRDLRGSTYSGSSSLSAGNRDTQYTRQSITPSLARESVTSEVYRDDITIPPAPATQVIRAAPRMVSVRSSPSVDDTSSNYSPASTPTTKGTGKKSGPVQVMIPGQGAATGPSNSARSVASIGKPTQVSIGRSGSKRLTPSRKTSDSSFNTAHSVQTRPVFSSPLAQQDLAHDESDEDDEHARGKLELTSISPFASPDPQPAESPFFDVSEAPSSSSVAPAQDRPNPYASMASTVVAESDDKLKRGGKGNGGLSAVIEEATKRTSSNTSGTKQSDPFDDSHSTG